MRLPANHVQRFALSNEVHARPPEPLTAPVKLSCIALTTDTPYREEDRQLVAELTKQFGATPPGPGVKHYNVDLGGFKLIWERHTEFTRYTFLTEADDGDPFASPAIEAAPAEWVANLPGSLIAAANASLVNELPDGEDQALMAKRFFDGNAVVGSKITGGAAVALTDFRIHSDGFTRLLIQNRSMTPWHAGRIVQRLLEIEVYRVMALMALPVAQEIGTSLTASESELAEITAAMTDAADVDEPELLDRLTGLQAEIERGVIKSQYRFSAANAYYALVKARIGELREERITGMQTFQEFTDRRLAPAIGTCQSVAARQGALSERVDRAAQLLSTRVDMLLEKQNQAVLESMNRRAELQLRLQKTVEGLSIAAITYYVVGVIGYFAKGLATTPLDVKADAIIGASAPIVLIVVGLGLWRARKHMDGEEELAAATRNAVAARRNRQGGRQGDRQPDGHRAGLVDDGGPRGGPENTAS